MHPVSGGSLFKNGINGMTFEEFQKDQLHHSKVESLGRPAHGLSEACQTFETAVPFLQVFLENEILGNGQEQVRKLLASKTDVWSHLNTYGSHAAREEAETRTGLIMSLFQCGAVASLSGGITC